MALLAALDRLLIGFYRLTGNPVGDYFLGTFLIALLAVVLGEFTISLAFRFNRKHLAALNARLAKMHNLSLAALKAGEHGQYRACNREANDAFGRVFFNAIAFSAAYLWPVPFVLAWMQMRFGDIGIPVPFTGLAVNYLVVFLICYVLARMLFGTLRPKLPYFGKIQKMLDANGSKAEDLESFADLLPNKG